MSARLAAQRGDAFPGWTFQTGVGIGPGFGFFPSLFGLQFANMRQGQPQARQGARRVAAPSAGRRDLSLARSSPRAPARPLTAQEQQLEATSRMLFAFGIIVLLALLFAP